MKTSNFYLTTFIKDFKIAFSYKMQFIFSFISIFISMFFIIIFSGLVDGAGNPVMDKYGGSYFVFLFFGFITAEMTMLFLVTFKDWRITMVIWTSRLLEQKLALLRYSLISKSLVCLLIYYLQH